MNRVKPTILLIAISLLVLPAACGSRKKRDHKLEGQIAVVTQNEPPVANAGSDRTVFPGQTIDFDGSLSSDDNGIELYAWDFDNSDGVTQSDAEGVSVSHRFENEGGYFVTLTVTDTGGLNDRDTICVLIEGEPDIAPPVAVISGDTEIMEGEIAHFSASASSDDKGIAKYRWDFDDRDGFQTQWTGESAIAEFPWPGAYTITLEVEDLAGKLATDTLTLNVLSDNAPDIVITEPMENMLLEGDVTVRGLALDDGNITLVEVKVNDGDWQPATMTSDNWATWEFQTNIPCTNDEVTGRSYRQVPLIVARGTDSDNNVGRPLGINEWFANAIWEFVPAPGEYVNNPSYNDPEVILGEPYVGALGSDPGEEVSLGGFGGYIVMRFYNPLTNDPDNPRGIDLIIYGNAFATSADGTKVWKEPGYVEVMEDTNGNGLPDEKWYLIPGSHLDPPLSRLPRTWSMLDGHFPLPMYYPTYPHPITLEAFLLPVTVLFDPTSGYVDCNPLRPDGDGNSYNTPDDPDTPGIDEGSCGGDSIDFEGVVDPDTGEPAPITRVDFVKITNGLDIDDPVYGRKGPELKGGGHPKPPRPNGPAPPN
ncbi:MAG: PKD domain-containing protein [Planctomycetota bacterium]